jgi:Baseplate J-like protein
MSDSTTLPCDCCTGATEETPALVWNRPGLSRISYRVGTHPSFKASMLAALSRPDFPATAPFTTREDSDFSIALLDAFAVTADILAFYQERLANESYLRTAVQSRSVFELARLVGYQPSPGVAASAPLAFTLNDAPGAPDPVSIPAGTRVQSVPPPSQSPVVFETAAPLTARIAYNALPAVTTNPVNWRAVTTSLWLEGISTALKPGDAILFVDIDRVAHAGSDRWGLRTVTAVTLDTTAGRTRIVWDEPLSDSFCQNATTVQLQAMRKRASLFGVNAPDPRLLPNTITVPNYTAGYGDYTFVHEYAHVDLDGVYPNLAPAGTDTTPDFVGTPEAFSWLVLSHIRTFYFSTLAEGQFQIATLASRFASSAAVSPSSAQASLSAGIGSISIDPGFISLQPRHQLVRQLYRVLTTADRAPLLYTVSAKATGLNLDTDDGLAAFVSDTRGATAFVQSEPLIIPEQPIIDSFDGHTLGPGMLTQVAGTGIVVAGGGTLTVGQTLGVIGKRARLQLVDNAGVTLVGPDGRTPITTAKGDVFLIDAYPPAAAAGRRIWSVLTTKGVPATLTAAESAVTLIPADKLDAEVSEAVVIAESGVVSQAARTTLTFTKSLARAYDRVTTRVNANVIASTHGETVHEILGGGDSSTANQSFTLKQSPLTYVSAAGGLGTQSTLQVWVNDLRWQEQPQLLDAGSRDQVFVTRQKNDGGLIVQFGDGQHGVRPPTGQTNVRAVYRKGLGAAGNVASGLLSQAIDRPGGLKGVSNPAAATGGADPDTADDARESAPLHIRTLERVVSLQDYEDFARAFAGVARSLATWTWFGRTRGVVVTVAGANGTVLDPNGDTIKNLTTALIAAGNPYVPISVLPHRPAMFEVGALILIDTTTYDPGHVLAAARTVLATAFGFGARTLGQGVTQSEVIATIQAVAGVTAVKLTTFTREDAAATLPDFLIAAAPRSGDRGVTQGAELLLIDPLTLTQLGQWQ